MKRVLIFGSCVSRDAFEYAEPGQYELIGYYARSSLASLATPPKVDKEILGKIESKFQRKMVEADMAKTFWRVLDEAEFDIFVMDFIDERFHLLERNDGAIHTISTEYKKAIQGRLSGSQIANTSDKKFELWAKSFQQLIVKLVDRNGITKLRINKVFWSNKTDLGASIPGFTAEQIESANGLLTRLYSEAERFVPSSCFIEYPGNLLYCDSNHKWGITPFHYNSSFYKLTLRHLQEADAAAKTSVDSNQVLTEIKFSTQLEKQFQAILANKICVMRGDLFISQSKLVLGSFDAVDISEDIDWQADPLANRTWQWHLNWFSFLGDVIALDHQQPSDTHLDRCAALLADWTEKYLETDLDHPFEFIWHDHATALRAEQVALFLYYVANHRSDWLANNQGLVDRFIYFLQRHGEILSTDSFYSEHTNHGLEQSRVLLLLSTIFFHAAHGLFWRDTAVVRINNELDFSFTEEGVHVENSPAYHYFVFKIFLGIISDYPKYILGELEGKFQDIAIKALVYLTHIIQPDGKLPILGDTEAIRIRDIFHEYFYGKIEYENFLYSLTGGKNGIKPTKTCMVFPKSGYAIFRNQWSDTNNFRNDFHVVFKAGCLSQYHRHQDEGSLIFNVNGENWLTDSGMYNHNQSSPVRKYMRSRIAHNVVHVADAKYVSSWDEIKSAWKVIEYGENANSCFIDSELNIYQNIVIKRRVEFYRDRSELELIDSVQCLDGIPRHFYFYWHIDSGKQIERSGEKNVCVTSIVSGKKLDLSFESDSAISIHIGSGDANGRIASLVSKVKNKYEASHLVRVSSSQKLTSLACVSRFNLQEPEKNIEYKNNVNDQIIVRHSAFQPVKLALPIDWTFNPYGVKNWCHHFMSLRWIGSQFDLNSKFIILKDFYFFHCQKKRNNPYYNQLRGDHTSALRLSELRRFRRDFETAENMPGVYLCDRLIKDGLLILQDEKIYRMGHNHALMVDISLLECVLDLVKFKKIVHLERIVARALETIKQMFSVNGVTREHSISYQEFNLSLCAYFLRLIDEISYENVAAIERLTYLIDAVKDESKVFLGFALRGCGEYFPIGDSFRVPAVHLLKTVFKSEVTDPVQILLPYSRNEGLYFAREGFVAYRKSVQGRAIHFFFTCGWESNNHKQNDELSFCLEIDGVSIFDDPGYSDFISADQDSELRSERSHSTPRLAGIEWGNNQNCSFDSLIEKCAETENGFALTASHCRIPNVKVNRSIILSECRLQIVDSFAFLKNGFDFCGSAHRFVLNPEIDVLVEGARVLLFRESVFLGRLSVESPKAGEWLVTDIPYVLSDRRQVVKAKAVDFIVSVSVSEVRFDYKF